MSALLNLVNPLSYFPIGARTGQDIRRQDYYARLVKFTQAWKMYEGEHKKHLKKVKITNSDGSTHEKDIDNVTVNYCRPTIDKGVAALMGEEGPSFSIDRTDDEMPDDNPDSPPPDDPEELKWLEKCWEMNKRSATMKKVALNGAVTGHTFVKLLPPYNQNFDEDDPKSYPRIVPLDSSLVDVWSDPEDMDVVIRYFTEYTMVDTARPDRVTYWRDEYIPVPDAHNPQRWIIRKTKAANQNDEYKQAEPDVEWPHKWPPICDCQNLPSPNTYFGIADIEPDGHEVNDAINFNYSNLNKTLRVFANPKTWGKGFRASEMKEAQGILTFVSEKAELHNLEMQSDLKSTLDAIDRLERDFHVVTRTPEATMGKVPDIQNVAGAALKMIFLPLTEKTSDKRSNYGPMLVEASQRLLELGKKKRIKNLKVEWPDTMPQDAAEQAATYEAHHRVGTSQHTIQKRLGNNPHIEEAHRKREANAAMQQQVAVAAELERVAPGKGASGSSPASRGGSQSGKPRNQIK